MIRSSHNHQTDGRGFGSAYREHRPADHYPQRDSAGSPGGGLFDANSKVTGRGLTGSGPFGRADCPVPPRARRALHLSFNSRGLASLRRRSAGGLSSLAARPVATLIRLSAFVAARHINVQSAHYLPAKLVEPLKPHSSTLSSSPVAVEVNHDVKGFRIVRTAFHEAGNVFRS